ncbi:MAG: hypothetical protein OEM52_04450 [bacterium]|nr:hypothetical protein [bacterium]
MSIRYVINDKVLFFCILFVIVTAMGVGCTEDDGKTDIPVELPTLSSSVLVSDGSNPVISPNGSLLLFVRDDVWMLRNGSGSISRLIDETMPQPAAAPVWFDDNERVVYYASGPMGSERNGIFLLTISNHAVTQLRVSGRDPCVGSDGFGNEVILYEEYDAVYTLGIAKITLPMLNVTALHVTGSKPTLSKFNDYIGYFGGDNGGRPVTARLSQLSNSRVLNSRDAFKIDFLDSNTVVFDGNIPQAQGATRPILFRANLTSGVVDTLYRFALEPTVSDNKRLTFRGSEDGSARILQLRNETLYEVSSSSGRFSVTSTGRVAYESGNTIRLSE